MYASVYLLTTFTYILYDSYMFALPTKTVFAMLVGLPKDLKDSEASSLTVLTVVLYQLP